MTPNLHGSHCFDGIDLRCGWPDRHRCAEPDCKRSARPMWSFCDAHAQALIDRVWDIKAPEPLPELPRWRPGL